MSKLLTEDLGLSFEQAICILCNIPYRGKPKYPE